LAVPTLAETGNGRKRFLRTVLCGLKTGGFSHNKEKTMNTLLSVFPARFIAGRSEADQRQWAQDVLEWDITDLPRRYFFQRPAADKGSYVLPLRQSFIKDARLMPGTRIMLALLVGWAGTGRPLETTQPTLAKHLQRSVRQVFRYLKDAAREGYLRYAYTKNRLGMITGLKIYLSFPLMRPDLKRKPCPKPAKPARTHRADTNTLIKDSYLIDEKLGAGLEKLWNAIRAETPSVDPACADN
jgi:hypothetical protein